MRPPAPAGAAARDTLSGTMLGPPDKGRPAVLIIALFLLFAVALFGPLGRSDAEERRSDIAAAAWTGHVHL